MPVLIAFGTIVAAYLLGSIPFGWIIVRIKTGKDVRKVESGRTGGTNAMRAAGKLAGLATACLDGLKGAWGVWLADAVINTLLPGAIWLKVAAGLAAILGHNYSIFLAERTEQGKWRLRGGAGGGTAVGGAFGLWPPSLLIIFPIGGAMWYFIGYASVTTMSAALIVAIMFAIRAALGQGPWEYVFYGIGAEILLVWALRPNIKRLLEGKERIVGWRVRKR